MWDGGGGGGGAREEEGSFDSPTESKDWESIWPS